MLIPTHSLTWCTKVPAPHSCTESVLIRVRSDLHVFQTSAAFDTLDQSSFYMCPSTSPLDYDITKKILDLKRSRFNNFYASESLCPLHPSIRVVLALMNLFSFFSVLCTCLSLLLLILFFVIVFYNFLQLLISWSLSSL